jgi:dinuclear metal center YbgI/SA1388 family protein
MASALPYCIADLCAAMQQVAPLEGAADWDNVGLLVGAPDQPVDRVLACIDLSPTTLAHASAQACQAIVAYHPPIFSALKRLSPQSLVVDAVRRNIALYSPHTAWDAVEGGSSDVLASAVGLLPQRRPLQAAGKTPAAAQRGIGRVGQLPQPLPFAELRSRLKLACGIDAVLQADVSSGSIERIAVCPGAGGGLVQEVLACGAQLYVTGELSHHAVLALRAAGISVLCTLHSNSERLSLVPMMQKLTALCPRLTWVQDPSERDPLTLK